MVLSVSIKVQVKRVLADILLSIFEYYIPLKEIKQDGVLLYSFLFVSALVIDDHDLNHDNYSLLHRLERYIYLGDDRHIKHRFCRGKEIAEQQVFM